MSDIDELFVFIILGVLFLALLVFLLWQRKRIGFQITAAFTAFGIVGSLGYLLYWLTEFGLEILESVGDITSERTTDFQGAAAGAKCVFEFVGDHEYRCRRSACSPKANKRSAMSGDSGSQHNDSQTH